MPDYKEMYVFLFRDVTKAIDTLQQSQQRTEQLYMDSEDKPIEFKTLEGKKKKPEKPEHSCDDGR